MHVMHHGGSGVEPLILDACLHNQAYDPQCEGNRADWLIEIIDAAQIQDAMQTQILSRWRASVSDNFWDQNQLCRLALVFARRGSTEFRSRLYAAFRQREGSADLIACEEIIELDGADGLVFVAERAGQFIADDPATYVGTFPLSFYDEKHGAGAAKRILSAAADQNKLIATYLEHVKAEEAASPDDPEFKRSQATVDPALFARFGAKTPPLAYRWSSWSAEDVIQELETTDPSENEHRFVYRNWGHHASEEDLRKVAKAMFANEDEARLCVYLRVFQACGLPEMDARLLTFADSENRDIRWITYHVLANHEHPTVRDLALDRIKAGRMNESELLLLSKNYRPGDWSLIESTIRLPEDQCELHNLVSDLLELFQDNEEESRYPMLLVYEHSPCGTCRRRAVEALLDISQAPDWVLEECRFDADEGTRRRKKRCQEGF